jgi:predicted amidohydrolase YtcJ
MSENKQLYFGGEIYTADDRCLTADAVAVRDGWIVAVGGESHCRSVLGSNFEPIDLKGAVLLPGFIDTHLHPPVMIMYELGADLSGVQNIAELQYELTKEIGQDDALDWILGFQFEEQYMQEARLPTRHDLDAVSTDQPILIVKRDGHMIVANTKAIQLSGATAATADPEGGVIDRESNGYPAGPFRETAAQILLAAMPLPKMQSIIEAATAAFDRIAANGITSVGMILQTGAEGVSGEQGRYDIPLMEMVLDHIPINLYTMLVADDLGPIEAARKTKLHHEQRGAGHRIGALKFWADGTFSSCTAYMNQPFSDHPDKKGFLIHRPDEIYRRMVFAHNAGLQIAIHVIGDACARICVDLFDRLLREYPLRDHRHRLEHASQLDAALIQDMARLNLMVSTQPLFIHSEKNWLHNRLGAKRTAWTYPLRSLFDAGVKVGGASDSPIESLDVLHAIQCCVTREGFEIHQSITVEEAVHMYTLNAAYIQFEDTIKGSIGTGKRADLVVLSANPVTVPSDQIRDIQIERTICGGKVVFEK